MPLGRRGGGTLFARCCLGQTALRCSKQCQAPEKNEQAVRRFSAQTVLVPIDVAVAVCYATVRLELKERGHPIPENDLWVAATCLELGLPLLTQDSHFDLFMV
ncbi:MAG: hypothetical protein C4B55_02025 [Candidatus Methanophagaceae archaeon]|nr:MAG: hypothetical protein C4B55_02025 [Methanophagales archaeon]